MLTFKFSGADGVMTVAEKLTSGMVGKQVKLEFTNDWENLTKTVIFEAGDISIPAHEPGEIATIPKDVLSIPGHYLKVAVYGEDAEGNTTPTIYAKGPIIERGADPWHASEGEPPIPKWMELAAKIEELEKRLNSGGNTGNTGSVDLSEYAKVEQLPKNVSELANDSGFVTRLVADLANYYAKTETYNREELDQKLSAIPKFSISVVDALPGEDISSTTIYLLKAGNESGDLYTEYIWTEGKWEVLGSQRVDLTGYAKEAWVNQLLTGYALTSAIPTQVSQLQNDAGYLTQHQDISGKLDADKLPEAVNAALAQAKESGEFDGEDGSSPHIGINGNWFIGTVDTGVKAAGTSPVKEQDYWTPEDQEAIVQQVLAVMGMHIVGVVDDGNNIVLTGKLTDGVYALKYEDADGNVTDIGTIDTRPGYTNMLLSAVDTDNTPYNGGQGWKADTRLNSSGAEVSYTGVECTGFIPFTRGDVIRFANIVWNRYSENVERLYFIQYDSNKAMLKQIIVSGFNQSITDGHVFKDADWNIVQINTGDIPSEENTGLTTYIHSNAAYFRISADEINADSIITINEEIPN